ncbi:MAG TPA: glucosamine-6-phosphate deaminase [Candidatus Saccharimonadales bacterium]|nr:glucosamine-6-phosphate deaminase [Candidatus Saccharimonadales bacterium]
MTPEVLPAATWADLVTERLVDAIAADPSLVLCLPTGSTPLPVFDRLPDRLRARDVSTAGVTIVGLDEFLGLPAGHPARCDAVLRRRLLDRLDMPVGRWIGFEVDAPDPDEACAALDAAVAAAGGIDLVVLGLGANGHIGMNEPGSAADAPTRVVALAPSTREAAVGYGADPPPTHGVTLGLASILAAREVWLLATGAHKAVILRRLVDQPPSPAIPASWLLDHPNLRVIVDDAAFS